MFQFSLRETFCLITDNKEEKKKDQMKYHIPAYWYLLAM